MGANSPLGETGRHLLRDHIFSTLLQRIFVELLFSKPSKNSVSLTILLSCNFKGLVFDFYLNRKRNEISVGWRRIVATYLHIS